jgi:hypothetical protein
MLTEAIVASVVSWTSCATSCSRFPFHLVLSSMPSQSERSSESLDASRKLTSSDGLTLDQPAANDQVH